MNARALRVTGGLLLMLFGLWAGLRVYSSRTATPATAPLRAARPPAGSVRVPAGEASTPDPHDVDAAIEPPEPVGSRIPDRLPEFSLGDRSGKPTSIAAWRGKSLIINFWATWCAPCRHEIPLLQSIRQEWRGKNVEVVGIAVDHRDKVVAFAEELKISYPLLIGEEDALDAAGAFGVDSPAFPFTVFTDQRGEVVALYVGELHKPQVDLILGVVLGLNENRVQLPQARRLIADGLRSLSADGRG
jgi:thiol-disulfide isomerase/thioredoxin